MNLMEMASGLLTNPSTMGQIASMLGTDEGSAGKGIAAALPALIGGLSQSAATPEGATGLLNMLNNGNFGSILENLPAFLNNPSSVDGLGLLSTLFGGQQEQVANKVAKASGLDFGAVAKLLPVLTPIVMGLVGNAAKSGNLDANGLTDMLKGQEALLRSSAPGLLGFLEKIDANDDGSIVDDLGNLFGKFFGGNR